MNYFKVNKIILSLLMIFGLETVAQDTQFSMFYSVPLYLNPAFAGSRHSKRAMIHQRFQWPNQPGKFFTTYASYDDYAPRYNSGFGGYIMYDNVAGGIYTSYHLNLQYAYELNLNKKYSLRFGLQGGIIQNNINVEGPLPSEVTNFGITSNQTIKNNSIVPDIGSGIMLYGQRLWTSLSLDHISNPSMKIIGYTTSPDGANLPRKITAAVGYKIPIKLFGTGKPGLKSLPDVINITPTLAYRHQGTADQIDAGIYASRDWFIAGLWYRGIPLKAFQTDNNVFRNNESIVLLLGLSKNGLGFGYSYDLTISSLGAATGGSHEFNLTYVFDRKIPKRIQRSLPCPDFLIQQEK
jgi:type IX secretion system PorP/SprF family membrane protein